MFGEEPTKTTEFLNDRITKAVQVGGDHYGKGFGHWDWALRCGLGYLEAAATKYIIRKKGDRKEELEKAITYMLKAKEWLQDRERPGTGRGERGINHATCNAELMDKLVDALELTTTQEYLCRLIVDWRDAADIDAIVKKIYKMIAELPPSQTFRFDEKNRKGHDPI